MPGTDGFCIIEVIFDENQRAIDYCFLEVNAFFEKQTGIQDAVGKRMRQVDPDHKDYWYEIYGKVALTGEAVRFETNAGALNRIYEVYAFPVSSALRRNVAILFTDITERKLNQVKLRESREMLERAQELAQLGSWELDLVHDQLSWSDEVYRIFGLVPQEFGATYEAFLERVHPEDRAAVNAAYTDSLRENRDIYEIEHRVVRAGSGEVRYVHEKCQHFRDSTGKIVRSVGMVHDITERKRAEEEARRSNEALRQLSQAVEQSPASVVITDITGKIEYVNPKFTKLTGYTLEEARGKNPNILKSGRTPPEVYHGMWETILAGGDWKGEFANRKKNGDLYWEAVSVSPITGEDGKVTHFVAVKEDITERKLAEQALRDAHDYAAWMARLSAENPNPVVRVSADGVVLFLNPSAAEQPGWDCIVGQLLPEPLLRLMERAAQQSTPVQEDLQLADRCYAISVTPLFENRYANLYGNDITMRKKAESALAETAVKLERSNRELEQFAFVASHDLQEPLRKIKMFGERLVEMLQNDCSTGAPDYLQRMQRATERMQTMINGLLELSRVNTRGGSFSEVRLAQVAQDALSDLELRVQAAGGKVIIDELPTIQADEMQMRQLFQNLIGNAIKFHHPDMPPVVWLSAEGRSTNGAPTVTVRVADNGIGFEQLYAERIFQPFQRLHGRNEYEGTGLGLAICQKIVERHHGTIEVESAPEAGSTFRITLPAKQAG